MTWLSSSTSSLYFNPRKLTTLLAAIAFTWVSAPGFTQTSTASELPMLVPPLTSNTNPKAASRSLSPSAAEPAISIRNTTDITDSSKNLDKKEQTQKNPKNLKNNDSYLDDTSGFALPDKPEENINNEFQQFIAQSTGYALPVFGRILFSGQSNSFAPSQEVAIPGDYILGVGDEIHIRSSGSLDMDYHAVIDQNGSISLPRIGSFPVAGIRYSEIESAIQQRVGRLYKDFHLYISLGQLRSMRVYVVGHVKHPGAYTVSSLSTLVNTLLNAGGPSAVGSLRNIQVKRAGRLVTDFDLYDLLLKGDKSKDIRLMSEDVIYVGPISKLIAINGSVNQPAVYEVRSYETLGDVLNFAGGMSTIASTDMVSVERIMDHKQRTIQHIRLTPTTLKQPVNEGDLITVSPISRKFDRVVTVRGHVAAPIRLQWKKGMHIKDAIPSKEVLITSDYYTTMERYGNPAFALLSDQTPKSDQTLKSDQKDLPKTDIRRLLKEPNWEYAVIERLRDDLSHEIIPFQLAKALEGDEKNNLLLQPDDIVTVFSTDDISVPRSHKSGFVRLEGEFKTSGIYRIEPNETLRQLIERTGGVTDDAHLYALELQRESARQRQIARYNEWLNRMERDLARNETNRKSLSQEETAIQHSEVENRRQLLERLRAIQPTGRVVLNFKDNYTPTTSDLPDLLLEDGDKIILPARSTTISVIGSVINDGTFLYQPEKSISDYLDDAGGATEFADASSLYIIRTDGSISSSNRKSLFGWLGTSYSSLAIQPGDTIVMPEKTGGQSFLSSLKDFATVFYQFGLGAAAIQVLRK